MDSILRHHRSQAQLFADNPDQLIPVNPPRGEFSVNDPHFAFWQFRAGRIQSSFNRNLQLEVTPHPRAIQILLFSDRPHKIN